MVFNCEKCKRKNICVRKSYNKNDYICENERIELNYKNGVFDGKSLKNRCIYFWSIAISRALKYKTHRFYDLEEIRKTHFCLFAFCKYRHHCIDKYTEMRHDYFMEITSKKYDFSRGFKNHLSKQEMEIEMEVLIFMDLDNV